MRFSGYENIAVIGDVPASQDLADALLGDHAPAATGPVETGTPSSDYLELFRCLFYRPAAVAFVGSSNRATKDVSSVTEDLACELARAGNRVVIVPVRRLLHMNPVTVSDGSVFMPGKEPHVWTWPASSDQNADFMRPCDGSVRRNWLDCLRQNFHFVLLDCPDVQEMPGVAEVAAMADAAVLAIEVARTSREQIHQNQQALQLRGAIVAGCILIRTR